MDAHVRNRHLPANLLSVPWDIKRHQNCLIGRTPVSPVSSDRGAAIAQFLSDQGLYDDGVDSHPKDHHPGRDGPIVRGDQHRDDVPKLSEAAK
jgi:hypothetical protein